jgi:hypothetical protein
MQAVFTELRDTFPQVQIDDYAVTPHGTQVLLFPDDNLGPYFASYAYLPQETVDHLNRLDPRWWLTIAASAQAHDRFWLRVRFPHGSLRFQVRSPQFTPEFPYLYFPMRLLQPALQ